VPIFTELVMRKAHRLHAEGKLSAADIAHPNAARIKLDESLP